MSFDLRAALRDTDGLVTIPPGTYTFSEPLAIPDRHIVIRGAGMALTSLIFTGEGTSGFTAQRSMVTSPLEISDMTLMTTAKKGGTAIDVKYAPAEASHDPSLLLERVRIRPAPGYEGIGAWSKGIVLAGAWSPIISRVWIQGRSSDMTKTDLLTSPMECAIDVGGSQEAKITYAQIACSQIGVRVTAPAQGKGEGFHFTHSAIVHAITGVRAEGGVFGGWAVPWLSVTDNHLFTVDYGVFATGRSDVVIAGNSFCGSQFSEWSIGVYLADKCRNARIGANSFWTTRPGQGHGIVIADSQATLIHNNVIDRSILLGVWLAPKATVCQLADNANLASMAPLIDSSGAP